MQSSVPQACKPRSAPLRTRSRARHFCSSWRTRGSTSAGGVCWTCGIRPHRTRGFGGSLRRMVQRCRRASFRPPCACASGRRVPRTTLSVCDAEAHWGRPARTLSAAHAARRRAATTASETRSWRCRTSRIPRPPSKPLVWCHLLPRSAPLIFSMQRPFRAAWRRWTLASQTQRQAAPGATAAMQCTRKRRDYAAYLDEMEA